MKSIKTQLLKIGFVFCFVCILNVFSGISQNGQVPELLPIPEASKLLTSEIIQINEHIQSIENSGGVVDQELKLKQLLFTSVIELLDANATGMTTFLAVSSNSNYKNQKMDDEAYDDLVNGHWDENMSELIRIITK